MKNKENLALLLGKVIAIWLITLGLYAGLSAGVLGDPDKYYNSSVPPHFIVMVIMSILFAAIMAMMIRNYDRSTSNEMRNI